MAEPLSFELQWEGGLWRPKEVAVVEEVVQDSLPIIRDGFDVLNVPIEGVKHVTLLKETRDFVRKNGYAETNAADNFTMFFDRKMIGDLHKTSQRALLSVAALHELLHCKRFEFWPLTPNAIAAHVHEGIAVYGHSVFMTDVLKVDFLKDAPNLKTEFDHDGEEAKDLVDRYRTDLMELAEAEFTVAAQSKFFESWHPEGLESLKIGYIAVSRSIEAGTPYPDTVALSFDDIIEKVI